MPNLHIHTIFSYICILVIGNVLSENLRSMITFIILYVRTPSSKIMRTSLDIHIGNKLMLISFVSLLWDSTLHTKMLIKMINLPPCMLDICKLTKSGKLNAYIYEEITALL